MGACSSEPMSPIHPKKKRLRENCPSPVDRKKDTIKSRCIKKESLPPSYEEATK